MAKTSAEHIKAVARYDAKTARRYSLKLNKNTDADIIARFETVGSIQTYIKRLIREDIRKSCNP